VSHGKLIIEIKKTYRHKFSELSRFEYDNGASQKSARRYGALERTWSCVVGWQSRYEQFRDSSFRVREILANENGSYGRRLGTVINIQKELDRERSARLVFDLLVKKQQAEQEEAEARAAAKRRGEKYVKPKVAKAPKVKKAKGPKAPKAEGELSRRDIRRAAKRACAAKEGNKDNWRAYL